jgi:hypothetical protein
MEVGNDGFEVVPSTAENSPDGLDFRGKNGEVIKVGDMERLDAQGVPRKKDGVGGLVEKREGEHASQARKQVFSPFAIPVQEDFAITARPETVPAAFKGLSQFQVIVDLTVEDEMELPIGG